MLGMRLTTDSLHNGRNKTILYKKKKTMSITFKKLVEIDRFLETKLTHKEIKHLIN